MGASQSSQALEQRRAYFTERNDFLIEHMPMFLKSEYCQVEKAAWISPVEFLIAFQSFLCAKNIKIPDSVNMVDPSMLKVYFNGITNRTGIYATGSYGYYVLVGVTLTKWPGTYETDVKAVV